ncbi:sugar ABC transporter permease [Fusibacter paucivorans]|uniref:Sugar ABC transporter permease n=2 Tax=Fusibacter paucivorans TaxID=76009 RepID=A0ABS5PP33_9FIRM|nr:sugar ABC transporter permease [Fusibacter paucivorans]
MGLRRVSFDQIKCKVRQYFKQLMPYGMVLPAMAILGLFVLYPIFYMIYLSFFKWNLIGSKAFVGLHNFIRLFSDKAFWEVLGNSFQYMFFTVFFAIVLAIILAVYLKRETKANKLLQSILFTPHIVSLISITFVWMWLMDSNYGFLNYLLSILGLPAMGWLTDSNTALYSLILISVWKSIGYNTLILISAMQAVPKYLYEAASLDNATKWTSFFKITLPMISPTLFFLTLMNMIAAFKVFEPVKIMTQGGPMNATNTLVYDIYQYGFTFYKIGYASALGVVLMIIIGICTILYFAGLSHRVHYR